MVARLLSLLSHLEADSSGGRSGAGGRACREAAEAFVAGLLAAH